MYIKTSKIRHSRFTGNPTVRRQRGDTMIEVLVTIIIIAVGVLGTAALQVTTLKNLSSSHSSSAAAMMADDLSERMRANPTAALDGEYDHTSKPGSDHEDCAAGPCTPAELAAYDLGVWWEEVNTVLPRPKSNVKRKIGTDTFRVTVYWDEDRSGSTRKRCPPKFETDLECYRFWVTL